MSTPDTYDTGSNFIQALEQHFSIPANRLEGAIYAQTNANGQLTVTMTIALAPSDFESIARYMSNKG